MIEYGLRLGNLLQDGKSKAILVVCKIEIGIITTIVRDREKFPLANGWYNEPIPLTEEWLVRFGFEKDGKKVWLKSINQDGTTLQIWRGTNFISLCRLGIAAIHSPCEHVHQLQNLYFSLTGQELKLNEKAQ